MLTSVEDEQGLAIAQSSDQGLRPALAGLLRQLTSCRNHLGQEGGLGKRREINPVRSALTDELMRHTCFANAPRTNQRQQTCTAQLRGKTGEQRIAPKQNGSVWGGERRLWRSQVHKPYLRKCINA